MLSPKTVGRGSAARKYDLLTILGSYALSQDRSLQRQTLRLICLITARYNWQTDQLSMGQTEIAKLWSVDPRTVKREMAVFRERGWLVERRASGRGRVTIYGLGMSRILEDTRCVWENIGPDLVERLSADIAAEPAENIVPFRPAAPLEGGETVWSQIAQNLHREDPSIYRAWLAALRPERTEEELVLHAPSPYHASYVKTHFAAKIYAALRRLEPGLRLEIAG